MVELTEAITESISTVNQLRDSDFPTPDSLQTGTEFSSVIRLDIVLFVTNTGSQVRYCIVCREYRLSGQMMYCLYLLSVVCFAVTPNVVCEVFSLKFYQVTCY